MTPPERTGTEAAAFPQPGEGLARSALLLAKPGIVFASALAGYAGMVTAAKGLPPAGTAAAGLAALVLAAVGAALANGVFDAALDRRMARLATRTASLSALGERRVLAAAFGLVTAALALAALRLNILAAALILVAVLSYAVLYTLFLKRRSPWGPVPGGIPGALPVLIGYASAAGTLRPDAFPLFVLMLLWQPAHFWMLALAWRDDYRAAGIPVLPVAMGDRYAKALVFLYGSALIPASAGPWLFGSASAGFAAFGLLAGIAFLATAYAWVVRASRYLAAFRASIVYLALLLAALVLDVALRG